MGRRIAVLVAILAIALTAVQAGSAHTDRDAFFWHPKITVRSYAMKLARRHGWASQFWAIDQIIRPESSWDPCAYNPSHRDCHYTGWSACGIPQADPCPTPWRGRLWETRFAQVRWLIEYIQHRYGDPLRALAYRQANGSY